MLMGLKLSSSSINKYITGTLNKGANGGKRVVFLGWNKGKGREWKRREGMGRDGIGKGMGRGWEGEGIGKGNGREG